MSEPVPRVRAWVALMLIAFMALSNVGKVDSVQQTPWIDRSIVAQYAGNLIISYNALVTEHYGYYPSPSILNNFRLYHAVGYNFNVTVMRLDNVDTDFAGLVFVPIIANSHQIVIDNKSTLIGGLVFTQFPNANLSYLKLTPNSDLGFAFRQGTGVSSNGTRILPFIYVANITTMYSNPMVSSANVASNLFQNDQGAIGTTTTQTQTATNLGLANHQGGQDLFAWVNNIASLIVLVAVVGTVIGAVWSKRVRHKLREWLQGG